MCVLGGSIFIPVCNQRSCSGDLTWFPSPPREDGSRQEGGRPGSRSVADPRNLGGPGPETPTETEGGAGEGGEQRPRQVREAPPG